MSNAYSRKLDEPRLMEHFLKTVLEETQIHKGTIKRLTKIEKKISKLNLERTTINNKNLRVVPFKSDESRKKLRKRIVEELYNKKRIKDDDAINLTKGGSKPPKGTRNGRQAYIIIGLPAAGKSTVANKVADLSGAFVLDNDYAKRKLPEFHTSEIGASLVHKEAELIVFGNNSIKDFASVLPLFFKCVQDEANLVIPKIGSNAEDILVIAKILKFVNYKVHLILVHLNRKFATKRALKRFSDSGRYVPLSMIFDGYANDPTITYFRLRDNKEIFTSHGEIDNTAYNQKIILGSKNSVQPHFLLKKRLVSTPARFSDHPAVWNFCTVGFIPVSEASRFVVVLFANLVLTLRCAGTSGVSA